MARQGFVALSLVVLLALFENGACLRCYQCNSQQDPSCADPYKAPAVHLKDCASQDSINYNQLFLRTILPSELSSHVQGAPRYCHKIVMQSGTVIRTCLDDNPTDINHTCVLLENASKLPQTDAMNKVKHCSVCEKDSCNGASSIYVSLPLSIVTLVATYLLIKQ